MPKRLNIGFFIPQLAFHYQESIWPGVSDYCRQHDLNLLVFAGKMLKLPGDFNYQHHVVYELASTKNLDGLVLCTPGLISFLSDREFDEYIQKFANIPMVSIANPIENIPSVRIEGKQALKDAIGHLIEHHQKRQIAFIKGPEHNPEAQERLAAYREALDEHGIELKTDLVVPGSFVMRSGEKAIRQLLERQQTIPDAVVCANDEMALGALKEIRARGYKVPTDIAVIGFDNIAEGMYCETPLTTVAQPLYTQAYLACQMLHDRIRKRAVQTEILLEANLKVRESCGCLSEPIQKVDDLVRKNLKKRYDQTDKIAKLKAEFAFARIPKAQIEPLVEKFVRQVTSFLKGSYPDGRFLRFLKETMLRQPMDPAEIKTWHNVLTRIKTLFAQEATDHNRSAELSVMIEKARILIGEMEKYFEGQHFSTYVNKTVTLRGVTQNLMSNFDFGSLKKLIVESLPKLNIESCFIVFYKEKRTHLPNQTWKLPRKSQLWLGYSDFGEHVILNENRYFDTDELLPLKYRSEQKPTQTLIQPLYYREEQIGYVLMNLLYENTNLYEFLSFQISSAIKAASLMQERVQAENKLLEALKELKSLNQSLAFLTEKDELTGVYNRRGFSAKATEHIQLARQLQEGFLLFFIDLDGLKHINDTYGHEEGDVAIVSTAKVLASTYRESDIVARLGGDEFVVIAVNCTKEKLSKIRRRFNSSIKAVNAALDKPYAINLSMGVTEFTGDSDQSLDELMSNADNDLYRVKKLKKKKRRKNPN